MRLQHFAAGQVRSLFFQIIIFGSFVPLCISFLFLFYIIKINREKLSVTNADQVHTIELSIQNSFYRIADSLYKVAESEQTKAFFTTKFQNQSYTHNQLKTFLAAEKRKLGDDNFSYCIYGSQGALLYAEPGCPIQKESFRDGADFLTSKNLFVFYVPYFYNAERGKHKVTLTAVVSLASLKKQFPLLDSVNFTSNDLNRIQVQARLGFDAFNKKVTTIFYMTILVSSLLSLVSILYGLRILYVLKRKTDDALKLAVVGEVAHMLAHDIQKPFENINQFVHELAGCRDTNDVRNLIAETTQTIQSSQSFINNLLNELKEADAKSLNVQIVNLHTILESCVSTLKQKIQNTTSIDVDVALKHTMQISGDPTKLARAFLNIIVNAVEAIQDFVVLNSQLIQNVSKPCIRIESFDYGPIVRIVFHNSHSFIPFHECGKIFDSFYTKKSSGGTGLGLAITKKMIELHGGSIHCESSDTGVNFIVDLPAQVVIPQQAAAPWLDHGVDLEIQNGHVFIIDDCPLALRSWKRQFQNGNAFSNVHTFLNFETFFAFVESQKTNQLKIDAIVCDYCINGTQISIVDALQKINAFFTKKIYIATHMNKALVENHLKDFNVTIIDKKYK